MKEKKNINRKKGFYTVEASIVVPLVIIAIITISAYGKIFGVFENVAFVGADCARAAMINSYVLGNDLTVYSKVKNHLAAENMIKNLRISSYRSGYKGYGVDQLISFNIDYEISAKAPLWNLKNFNKSERFGCRKFVGKTGENSAFTFDRMEIEEKGRFVYLFPLDGERYHSENCSYVVPAYFKRILNQSIKEKYGPCSQCHSQNVIDGSEVYIFKAYGDFYHKGDCSTVRKNVIKADLTTAIDKGYTPCSKCGGGQ